MAETVVTNVEWGASYAAMLGGNPSANGTFIGVVELTSGAPDFGLRDAGGDCRLDTTPPPVLGGATRVAYDTKRGSLVGASSAITSDSCKKFFIDSNRDDWVPARANYSVEQVLQAVSAQQPFEGLSRPLLKFSGGSGDILRDVLC